MERQQNTEYILDLSYGKDSLGCLEVIERLGLPLDRIVHAEVWATDTIPADLPPMVEFKAKADKIILERYGIAVEHVCAMKDGKKVTYESIFYSEPKRKQSSIDYIEALRRERERECGASRDSHLLLDRGVKTSSSTPLGFPSRRVSWCVSKLKTTCFKRAPIRGAI